MASSMTSDQEDTDWVKGAAAAFDFVRFTMSDIHGISRSKLIPRRHVDEKLKSGISMSAGKQSVKQISGLSTESGSALYTMSIH